jgi:hypothetical protein
MGEREGFRFTRTEIHTANTLFNPGFMKFHRRRLRRYEFGGEWSLEKGRQ